MAKCVVLASRQAMLEDARAVMAAVVRNAWDKPTLVLAGELAASAAPAGSASKRFMPRSLTARTGNANSETRCCA